MVIFNIITACIRPQNLPKLLKSIQDAKTIKVPVNWYIVLDQNVLNYSEEKIQALEKQLKIDPEINIIFRQFRERYDVNWPLNLAFDEISEGLICLLDDDNILHPDYFKTIAEAAHDKTEIGILYSQLMEKQLSPLNPRIRKVYSHLVLPGYVDAAQLTISANLLGDFRWPKIRPDSAMYSILVQRTKPSTLYGKIFQPDGEFIAALYAKHRNKFVILKQPLCYYNYLVNSK